MTDLNKIINEQRERIEALEKELLDWKIRHQEASTSLGEVCQRAEAAERERDEADAEANQLYDLAQSLEVCSEYLKINFANRKTHLAKFAIEQQIKGATAFAAMVVDTGQFGWSDSQWLTDFVEEYADQLRQQLNGGE